MSVEGRAGRGQPSGVEVAAARRRRWVTALVVVVVVAAVVLLFSPVVPSSNSGGPAPVWRQDAAKALSVVGLAAIAVGVLLAARAGAFIGGYAAQMRAFSRAQRRLAQLCVRRGQPAPHEVSDLAVAYARATVRQRYVVLAFAGIAANVLAMAVRATNLGWAVADAVMAVVLLAMLVIQLVAARRARRWLATYAPSPSAEGAAR